MIIEQPVFNFLEVRIQDKYTQLWTSIAAETTTIKANRGGNINYGGVVTVDAGTLNIIIKNLFDPAVMQVLSPEMKIQVYNSTFATPDEGSVFLGTIDDIETNYVFNPTTNNMDAYVSIYASDAIASHTNRSVIGISTETGFQRWEDRIATLAAKSVTEVIIPSVNADVPIYSI